MINNILAIGAHPDDIEMMAGGSLIKMQKEQRNICAITFTNGAWKGINNKIIRNINDLYTDEKNVKKFMQYKYYENLNQDTLKLEFKDKYVVKLLKVIEKFNIDTIICPWEKDTHHDHEIVARIAISASKRVPNLLMGQINYYAREIFTPNFYIDISDTWEHKINALKKYKSEWKRVGSEWNDFLDLTSKYYGKIIGVKRAEGFIIKKYLF